ncbi:MAG: glutamate synthase subunit beta [Prevotellaceae bacterium]|jgi:glutamate synthase (NADPH/NADH) small chain|nr:glutamate synthase subunit beta [Prevotellaceae bacterium]
MGNPKAFLSIARKEAGYRALNDRINDYAEVEQTLNTEDRRMQASRCMDCGVPFCHWSCPLGNRQPEWQDALYKGKWSEAYKILTATNDFPEFTGRVCPALCEKSCVLALSHEPVTIRENEVAVAEKAFDELYATPRPPQKRVGRRVAIVGSGPAGLAAANQLNQGGFNVTVYEKDEAVGGLLRLGIPDFKLNKKIIDRRVALMEQEGVKFITGVEVGKGLSPKKLLAEYDAVCLCIGAGVPRDLKVEGRELGGIYFALQLLRQQNRVVDGQQIPPQERITAKGKHVLVIGGGDTGSDCVGTSVRQGALSVTQIEIMPKPPEGENPNTPWPAYPLVLKTSSSHEEGCTRRWLLDTRKFTGQNGAVTAVEVEEVEWTTNPDGRPQLNHTGRKETIKADLVLLAMGFVHPVYEGLLEELGVALNERKNISITDGNNASVAKIFAAGDAALGASLVVRAIDSGRKAAKGIADFLQKN